MSTAPPGFSDSLKKYCESVSRANSEASKAFQFLVFTRDAFKDLNADYLEKAFPELEKHLSGKAKTLAFKGRIDAFLGNLIIEFKKTLDKKSLDEAESELRRYISILWTQEGEHRTSFITIATDGVLCMAYRPRTGVEGDVVPDDVTLDQIDRINLCDTDPGQVFVWLDRYMLTGELLQATAEAFTGEFGLNRAAFSDAQAFLKEAWKTNKEDVLYEQWASFLRIVYGSSVDSEDLFIRHTYLATLAKLLAYSSFSGGALPISSEQIGEILEGRVFEKWNIHNFLEEDFFSWVARSSQGIRAAGALLERLAKYDLTNLDEDILKSLYQELVDPEARHDLGEYYTPDWLAELIVEKVVDESNKSVLDPACGSGTFLAAAIRRKKELLRKSKPRERLDTILNTVKGIDVHPLAVILSRTNFLASLGTKLLSARQGPISIPVYLADSIRLPESNVSVFEGVKSFKIDAEKKVLRLPLSIAQDPIFTDRMVEAVKEYAKSIASGDKADLESFRNLVSQKVGPQKAKSIDSNVAKVLLSTSESMAELIKDKKDTVWAFILKNIYKPLFLKDHKFDVVVGNPPWLSYKDVRSTDYQGFLKKSILEDYNLLDHDRAELIAQMELSTLFFARVADLYLADDGVISFVMPRSIFVSDQHHNFRKCTFKPKMKISELLDLEDVEPLFHVPSCTVTARKGSNTYPVDATIYEGKLPGKNSKLGEATRALKHRQTKYNYYEIGQRSFLESTEFAKVLKAIDKGERSQYYEKFTQGATIVPHSVWFVDPVIHERLTIDPTRPSVKSSEEAIKDAKEPYKDVRLEGEIESEFLFQIATGSELAPFCTTKLQIAILPIEPNGGNYHVVRAEEAQRKGYTGLRNWLHEAEGVWKSKRGEKADKMDVYDRLDWSSGLTNQNPRAKYRVLYNKSGTYLVACVIENSKERVKFDSSKIRISGTIADDTTYRFDTDNYDEAMFVSAMLNAPIVDALIKPMQTRGQWGPRDIHKKVLEIPLPKFNPKNKKHRELVLLAQQAQAKAEILVPVLEEKYVGIGKIRQLIKVELEAEILRIDTIVRDLLAEAGSLPNGIEDYLTT
jgi:hypothetical protein